VAEYTLPPLPYDYGALAPHISGKIMELHHDRHHQAYVTGANTALEKLAAARDASEAEGPTALASVNLHSRNLAFNLGGHVNHSAFWTNLSPDGGDRPVGELAAAIDQDFGSFEKFQAHFGAVATGVQGSGWGVLAWDSVGQRLVVVQMHDQHANLALGLVPVVLLDVWEHAYYLDYLNSRPDYIKAWWNVVNWADAQARFEAARSRTAGLLVA
jgi:Fe-Mn family superoxide dismutase